MAAGEELKACRQGSGPRWGNYDAVEVDSGWQRKLQEDSLEHDASGLADGEDAQVPAAREIDAGNRVAAVIAEQQRADAVTRGRDTD
jgi:hypothetical protein